MEQHFWQANELGVRLEMVGGLPLWETYPVLRHQKAIDRIRASIECNSDYLAEEGCACIHAADVYVSFPDGSLMRPDIAIFCREPDEEDKAITLVPEAVVEVISKGYEIKDLEIAPRFYLSQGVKDVIVFDPHTLLVWHIRNDKTEHGTSPLTIDLKCGCRCTV